MRKPIPSALYVPLFAFALLLPAGLRAEEEHRELGAHVHGHGTLNIAIEDKRVALELEVPGMDIVGFEHAATSDDQKQKVEEAKEILQRPLDIFAVPAAAGCTVVSADVAIEAEHHHDDGDDHDHDHDAKDAKDGDHDHADHDRDDHDGHSGHDSHEGHNQFHANYALDCSKPSDLATIGFDYFKHFAGAQGLTVNIVTAKGQSKYEVSRDKPTLDLNGIM